MQHSRPSVGYSAFILIAIGFLLFIPPLSHAAEKPRKAAVTKQSAKKSTKRAGTKTEAPAVDENTARTAFDTFTRDWMGKMVEAEEFQRTKQMKVTESNGTFTAEYTGYLPERSIEVRKTAYKETPYVGTLTYQQRTLRCTGKTKEDAIKGPFEQVKTSEIREIFRFTNGKWVY